MFKNLIGGEWVEGPRVSRNINPSDTRDVVGEFAQADAAQTRQAIAAATQAQPAWGLSTPQQRFDILDAAGTEILARKAELGDLLAREEGKTLPEAIGEVARAGNIFKFFAGEALRLGGEVVPSVRPGVGVEVTREPVGIVGLITPWNFPIAIPAWKIAPALACGNAVVLKPADLVPGSAWAIADILHRAGLPAGVFNLVMGRERERRLDGDFAVGLQLQRSGRPSGAVNSVRSSPLPEVQQRIAIAQQTFRMSAPGRALWRANRLLRVDLHRSHSRS